MGRKTATVKKFYRVTVKAMKFFFIVFCIYLASLFFRDQQIPREWLDSILDSCSTPDVVVRCEAMSFGFRHGLCIQSLRVFDRTKPNSLEPVISASDISVNPLLRHVRIRDLHYPRLPESYYGPVATPPSAERDESVELAFPSLPDVTLELIRPDILGIRPQTVRATVSSSARRLEASDVRVVWPDLDYKMSIDGFVYVDLDGQRVYGEVRGEARQAHIRPLLVALDIPVSVEYMDAFTEVSQPVPAFCSWDVNLVNAELLLKLKLHPTLGRYNGVPMRRADGDIEIHSYMRNGIRDFETTVGPLAAVDTKGRLLEGKIVVHGTNNLVNLEFDAHSGLELKDTLAIIDYLNDGTLDCLACETPPQVTVSGILATEVPRQAENDLHGTLTFDRGTFFGIPVSAASLDYGYVGDVISFDKVSARGKDGGLISGNARIFVPGLDADKARFAMSLDYRDGSLAELADVLSIDFGDKTGKVSGTIELEAPVSTNLYPRLNARGSIRIREGHLAQMPLFAGLTELLADTVPGIATIVNQSQASADYVITNGILRSDNILVEGGVVSIKALGTYDIPRDDLDFKVQVRLLKDENILSTLVHGVTWPFTKLLLEFTVTGSSAAPKWHYISVLDRVF